MQVVVKERNGKLKAVDVMLTGHENAKDLLNILGLDPTEHAVKAGRRALECDEIVPPQEEITVEDNAVAEDTAMAWSAQTKQSQNKIALTLATHFARKPSQMTGLEVKPEVTPHQLADTLVKRFGGINAGDVTQMVDESGRNLMETNYRDRSFEDLGVKAGETLNIQGDITQGFQNGLSD